MMNTDIFWGIISSAWKYRMELKSMYESYKRTKIGREPAIKVNSWGRDAFRRREWWMANVVSLDRMNIGAQKLLCYGYCLEKFQEMIASQAIDR